MKGFDVCLTCGVDTKNKKYCSDKCKSKYYYNNNNDVRENKINNAKKRRLNIFYVYGFYYKSNDKPFYIGKGSGNRYLSTSGRSKEFNEIINNNEYYSKIIQDNLFEDVAFKIEYKLINEIDGLINKNDRMVSNRKCPSCKRDDVEFYENTSQRKCKDCMKEIYINKKEKRERENINLMIDYLEKGELSIINLYKLIVK